MTTLVPQVLGLGVPELLIMGVLLFVAIPVAVIVLIVLLVRKGRQASPPRFDGRPY